MEILVDWDMPQCFVSRADRQFTRQRDCPVIEMARQQPVVVVLSCTLLDPE